MRALRAVRNWLRSLQTIDYDPEFERLVAKAQRATPRRRQAPTQPWATPEARRMAVVWQRQGKGPLAR